MISCNTYTNSLLSVTLNDSQGLLFRHPPRRGVKYCDQRVCMSVCLSVCLLVSPLVNLKNTCPDLWPWLGPSLMTKQHVMYFPFCGWHHVFFYIMHQIQIRSIRDLFTVTRQVAPLNCAAEDEVCYRRLLCFSLCKRFQIQYLGKCRYNGFDNRLYRVYKHLPGCQTGCMTTGCIV